MMKKIYKIPLFDFHLDHIEDCPSIKKEERSKINWFNLTCGYYRIAAGDNLLLNYSNQIVDKWKRDGHLPDKYFVRRHEEEYPSYVGYYVGRLWLDLIEMLPVIREPLPQKLETIMNDPIRWKDKVQGWIDNQPDEEDDKYWDIICAGTSWLSNRKLDSGYLSPDSPIYIYLSNDNMIHIVWDNRDIKIENIAAWSSDKGKFSLAEDLFLQEVQSFHDRFLDLMKSRIEWVISNRSHQKNISSSEYLREQHKSNENYLFDKLKQPLNDENFDKVFEAIEKMGIGYGV